MPRTHFVKGVHIRVSVVGIGIYKNFYCPAVKAGFYSDEVECLLLDPAAEVRFPPRVCGLCFGHQDGMSRNYSVVPSRLGDESF